MALVSYLLLDAFPTTSFKVCFLFSCALNLCPHQTNIMLASKILSEISLVFSTIVATSISAVSMSLSEKEVISCRPFCVTKTEMKGRRKGLNDLAWFQHSQFWHSFLQEFQARQIFCATGLQQVWVVTVDFFHFDIYLILSPQSHLCKSSGNK